MPTPKWVNTSFWYPILREHTFFTAFVKLTDKEIVALANGRINDPVAPGVIQRIDEAMDKIPMRWRSFVTADVVAPTDTGRFVSKFGAVVSAESAWRILCESSKVRLAIAEGDTDTIVVRPYRPLTRPREFRLFIYEGELKAMSQFWLTRHFRRLNDDGLKKRFWDEAVKFVESIKDKLPEKTLVMDVYFTRSHEILIIDLNVWGPPTNPLLMSWNSDWKTVFGLRLIPEPEHAATSVKA